MTLVRLPHVDRFRDRHGKRRYYFRRGHGARVALPGSPGTAEFMSAYQQALERAATDHVQRERGAPGTFDRLISEYFVSPGYEDLEQSSKDHYRRIIERGRAGECRW